MVASFSFLEVIVKKEEDDIDIIYVNKNELFLLKEGQKGGQSKPSNQGTILQKSQLNLGQVDLILVY